MLSIKMPTWLKIHVITKCILEEDYKIILGRHLLY